MLYNLLHPRYKLFIKDIQKFIIISEDVIKKYIKQYLTNEKYDEAINFFNEYIVIHIHLMHQLAYLRNGICSFRYHINEREKDCPSKEMHTRTTNYDFGRELRLLKYMTPDTKRIAYNQSSKYLTLASIEVISIFIEDESNQSLKVTKKEIGKAKLEIDKKEFDMKGKVSEVAELLRPYNLTSDHKSDWSGQEIEDEPFDIFNYKYNMIKINSLTQVVLKSQKINYIKNYQSSLEEMEKFFERTQNQLRDMTKSC